MALRVQTQDDINFGNAGAAVRVSHVRAQDNDDTTPIIKQLPVAIQIAAGAPMRIPAGLFDVVYPAGDLTNAHLQEGWIPHWQPTHLNGAANPNAPNTGRLMKIDLMTDANTVVAVAGYAQQTYRRWAMSSEAD